jgi:hypothetical protein
MFAGGNAVVKWQLATYPLGEVAFGRTLFAFLTVAAIVLPRAGWSVLRTRRYRQLSNCLLLWPRKAVSCIIFYQNQRYTPSEGALLYDAE